MRIPFLPAANPAEVIVSERAHAAIVAETFEQHPNETGGILLGHCIGGIWHVIEAIDPGPAARFTPVTFEYDTAYVNHLARKTAARYQHPLALIGLWHRHPGSFDRFSPEDDVTNRRYAEQSADGAISCLVNLDPHFRITAYHVPADLRYRRLRLHCGDGPIPHGLQQLRQRRCLHPAALKDRHHKLLLQNLLDDRGTPPLAGPLPPELLAAMDGLLAVLADQRRYAYALRVQGPILLVALVEHEGPGQHRLHLERSRDGTVLIRDRTDAEARPFDAERFRHWIQRAGS